MPSPARFAGRPVDAVVFDLDGTLIDSADDLGRAANRLLAEEGRRALSMLEVRRFIGDGARVLVQRAMAETGTAATSERLDALTGRFIAHYEADATAATTIYPSVIDTLDRLRAAGLRIGVCTNKPQAATGAVLQTLGLAHRIDAAAGGDRFPVRKPDAGHLLGTLDLLGVPADRAVMVGDNEHDAAVARAAGTGAVLVTYGYARTPLDQIDTDARIDRLDMLLELLGLGAGSIVDNAGPRP
ncbi:2-phosphoglycolate phosphatase [alpha proteobacterium BAL199]|jgi:phosphoglycolate phosphatase|nr:2-phosphoglycolate phosphatase [alpha proteobacterium BAL199]